MLSEWQPDPLVPADTVNDRIVGLGPVISG